MADMLEVSRHNWAAVCTCGNTPTPRGVMGIAQGATDRPVKPNWMAAMVSWNRFVLVEKNTGALMDTAFAIAWEIIPLISPCPSFCKDVACTGAHDHVGALSVFMVPDTVSGVRHNEGGWRCF